MGPLRPIDPKNFEVNNLFFFSFADILTMAQKNACTWKHAAAAAGLLVIIAACIITAGCTGSTGTDTGSPAGSAWTLLSYASVNGTEVPVLQGTTITADFTEDGLVTGSAGCNGYSGSYTVSGTTIEIASIASTLMACTEPPGVMDQESRYLDLLGAAAAFRIEGDRLTLLDANGTAILTYEKAAAPETVPLEGPTWELLSYSDGNASMVSVIAGTTVTAAFENGSVGGSAGCNSYGGEYTADGSALTVGTIFRTEMYCLEPAGVMDQEDRYLELLGAATGYRIEGDRLTITDAGGNAALVFRALPKPEALPLTNTTWTLTTIGGPGETVSSVIAGTEITAVFENDSVGGSAGCNTYGGDYTVDGSRLTVGSIFQTKMNCNRPAGVMEQEDRYLNLLGRAAAYQIEGVQLTLFDADGNATLFFEGRA